MKWITYNIMAIAFLAAAMYLFKNNSHNWGWLVFCSLISSSMPTDKKEEKKETPAKDEADFIREIEKRVNERNN